MRISFFKLKLDFYLMVAKRPLVVNGGRLEGLKKVVLSFYNKSVQFDESLDLLLENLLSFDKEHNKIRNPYKMPGIRNNHFYMVIRTFGCGKSGTVLQWTLKSRKRKRYTNTATNGWTMTAPIFRKAWTQFQMKRDQSKRETEDGVPHSDAGGTDEIDIFDIFEIFEILADDADGNRVTNPSKATDVDIDEVDIETSDGICKFDRLSYDPVNFFGNLSQITKGPF